jgi:hypothetical protein
MRGETFEWSGVVRLPGAGEVSGLAWLSGLQTGVHAAPDLGSLATAELVGVERGRVELIATVPHPRASTMVLLLSTAVELVALTLDGDAGGETTGMSTTWATAVPAPGPLLVAAWVVGDGEVAASAQDAGGRVLATASSTLQPARALALR